MKLRVLPPDINHSVNKFIVVAERQILYGLAAVKGVGEAAIESILEARKNGPFVDLWDFLQRVDLRRVNKRTLEALIKARAFAAFKMNARQMLQHLEELLKAAEQAHKHSQYGQMDLFAGHIGIDDVLQVAPVTEFVEAELLAGEKVALGYYLSSHPVIYHSEDIQDLLSCKLKDLDPSTNKNVTVAGFVVSTRQTITKRGKKMGIVNIEDDTARVDVLFMEESWLKFRPLLLPDTLIVITAELSIDNFNHSNRLIAREVISKEEFVQQKWRGLELEISQELPEQDFQQLLEFFKVHQGELPVKISYVGLKVKLDIRCQAKIKADSAVLRALKGIIGDEAVKIVHH